MEGGGRENGDEEEERMEERGKRGWRVMDEKSMEI